MLKYYQNDLSFDWSVDPPPHQGLCPLDPRWGGGLPPPDSHHGGRPQRLAAHLRRLRPRASPFSQLCLRHWSAHLDPIRSRGNPLTIFKMFLPDGHRMRCWPETLRTSYDFRIYRFGLGRRIGTESTIRAIYCGKGFLIWHFWHRRWGLSALYALVSCVY